MQIPDEMPVSQQLAEIADAQILFGDGALVPLLLRLSIQVRRMERTLDEIVADAAEDARRAV